MEFLSYIFQGIFTAVLWLWWILVPILAIAAWQNYRKAEWAEKQEHILLTIKIPRSNEKDPTAAEMMFAALHGILKPKTDRVKEGTMQEHLAFEMVAQAEAIHFYVGVPVHLRDFVESQIYAQYPSAEINSAEDYTTDIDIDDDGIDDALSCAELKLTKNDIIPIKTFQNFKVDPLAGITSALAKLDNEKEQVWIQMLIRPLADEWQAKGISYIQAKKSGQVAFGDNLGRNLLSLPLKITAELVKAFMGGEDPKGGGKKEPPKLSPDVESSLSAVEEKVSKLGYDVKIRIISLAKTKVVANQRLQAAVGAFKQFNTINLNGIAAKKVPTTKGFLEDFRTRAFYDKGFILNVEELASLYHLPHTSVETPNINWTSSKTAEPPVELPTTLNSDLKDLTLFAETNFRHQKVKFGIKTDDRRRHAYIIGKSGMGKSKLLEQMMQEDIDKGNGFALIDPNGDLIFDTLKKIPEERIEDVIYFDPADVNYPIAFNPLEYDDEGLKNFVSQEFVFVLAKMFGHSWGPRLEYILNYTILALLDYPDRTIMGITRMLVDKKFRKKVVDNVKDPVVKKFWVSEFSTYNDRFASEAVAPILNKVGQFVASPLIRNIMGQPKGAFNLRDIMDNKKILLINLSTGRVGSVNSALLGGFLITKIQQAAMSRANIPHDDRVDFFLYVDEFQHFATESFATILSEARKYKLSLTVANQYIAQMDEVVKDAVLGNVGTMISFKVGADDASKLEKEFKPPFEANDIINLDRQQIYLKTSVDGKTTQPFSAVTLTIPDVDKGNSEKIIERTREKFASPKAEVEAAIAKWNNIDILTGEDLPDEDEKKPEDKKETSVVSNSTTLNKNKNKNKSSWDKNKNIDKGQIKNAINEVTKPKEERHEKKEETVLETKDKPIEKRNEARRHDHKEVDKEALKKIISKALFVEPRTDQKEPEKKAETSTQERVKVQAEEERVKEAPLKNEPETEKRVTPEKEKVEETTLKTVPREVLDNPNKNNEVVISRPEKKEEDKEEAKPLEIKNNTTEHNAPQHHKIEKSQKIITPNNFKELKEIHPHERVVIKTENTDTMELKQGEEIVFKKEEEK